VWSTPPGETFVLDGATAAVSIDADSVRPHQQPGPPIILGGSGGPRSSLLTAAYADEYNVGFRSIEVTKEIHDRVRASCEKTGRDPGELVYSAAQVVCCGADAAEVDRRAAAIGRESGELREHGLAGTPAEVVAKINAFSEAGVERLYLQVLDLTDLDQLRLIAEEVGPHIRTR
jgi:alkanesulfonate monooxygenase